jgi:ribose transport system permease protein
VRGDLKNAESSATSKNRVSIPSAIPLFIVILIAFASIAPKFLSALNLTNILLQSSPLAIIALGMSLVMLTNGIDLSVGSLISLAGIAIAILLGGKFSIIFSIIAGILVGSFFGLFSGIIISKMKLPSFIVTLGTMVITASLALVLCNGETLYWDKNWFNTIALKYFLGIPISFCIVMVVFILMMLLIHHTPFGVYIYGLGSNEEALRLCGANVNFYKTAAYLMSGCFAGVAGVMITSRIASGNPTVGTGFEFEAIASAAIGGISFRGGKGHPGFALLSAVTITMLTNGLGLMGFTTPWQYCGIGVILIIGMFLNRVLANINLSRRSLTV